ncbi:MAG TPA: trans-aconitate 2-methyltransferase [Actinomycetes bacterium]|nr:trans-aconitate 2-methyltransferase [Actinomycetes bacterium]
MRWDPEHYLRYGAERARPFRDLLARVGADDPQWVVDLGCGPGNLTAELAQRWPGAMVTGVDSSPDMVAAAQEHAIDARLEFVLADVRSWASERAVDVAVANALLQWVPGHLELLGRLVDALSPRGWLAIQVPANFASPSHTAIAEVRAQPRWRERLGQEAAREPAVATPEDYLERLAGLGCDVDAWETTYLHVLQGRDAVLEWVRGTALRPVLSVLDAQEAAEFEADLAPRLRTAYPQRAYGTVLPFRRLFAVARRRADGTG